MTIQELNERRAATATTLRYLGQANVPTDPTERLKQDANFRLACDANRRAEREYQAALASISTEELIALTGGNVT